MSSGPRSVAASVVGWLLVAVVVWLLFGSVLATIRFVLRMALIAAVLFGLLWAYLRLKGGGDD